MTIEASDTQLPEIETSECGDLGKAVWDATVRIGKTVAVMLVLIVIGGVVAVAFNYLSGWGGEIVLGPEYRNSIKWVAGRAVISALLFDVFLLASVYRVWWFAISEFRRSVSLAVVVLILAVIYTMYAIAFGVAAVLFAPEGAVGRMTSAVAIGL
jgi:hypothetical protein